MAEWQPIETATDRLTPEEFDAIRKRHHKTNQYFEISESCWDSYYQANDDRAALLRHAEALEQEVKRLREERQKDMEALNDFYATLKKYGYENSNDLVDRNIALEQEVERLRDENRHLSYRVNISPETAKLSSPAIAIAAQHDADNRVKAVERKLERLVEELNGIGLHHKSWNPSTERAGGWNDCRELVREIVAKATGEGK